MATDPALDNILQQYATPGGGGSAAPTPGGGPTSQQYWAGTNTSKAANKTYTVYMGEGPAGYDVERSTATHGKTKTMTESQAVASFHAWSAQQVKDWKDLLIQKGLLDPSSVTYAKLQKEWTAAVQGAAQAYTVGGQKVTPYDMVDLMGSVQGNASAAPSGALKPGTTRSTETDRVADHVSDEEATTIINNAFQQAVGRAPSDTEREEFANRLHTAILKNPTTTKVVASMDATGNVTKDVTSTGGFGSGGATGFANSMALSDAQADPEYGAYQASTTYFNALLNAIKSPT